MPENQATMTERFFEYASETSPGLLRGVYEMSRSLNGLSEHQASLEAHPKLKGFVQRVATAAYKTTDEDFEALRAAFCEDQIFEILWASILGSANGRYELAMQSLEEAEDAPEID